MKVSKLEDDDPLDFIIRLMLNYHRRFEICLFEYGNNNCNDISINDVGSNCYINFNVNTMNLNNLVYNSRFREYIDV